MRKWSCARCFTQMSLSVSPSHWHSTVFPCEQMTICIQVFRNITYCMFQKLFLLLLLSIHGRQKVGTIVSNEFSPCWSENVLDFQKQFWFHIACPVVWSQKPLKYLRSGNYISCLSRSWPTSPLLDDVLIGKIWL